MSAYSRVASSTVGVSQAFPTSQVLAHNCELPVCNRCMTLHTSCRRGHWLQRRPWFTGHDILVAEDNDADIILFQEALQHHQIEHQLHIAIDGQAALDFVARMGTTPDIPCPDVMLLDLNLPKVDGPTILKEFRKHPECQHTPVVVVTSSDAEKDRAKVAAYGATRYFRKPSDFEAFLELGAIIHEVITEQAQAGRVK